MRMRLGRCLIAAVSLAALVSMPACSGSSNEVTKKETSTTSAVTVNAAATEAAATSAESIAASTEASTPEGVATEAATASANQAVEIPRLPKVGMSATLIDATELGVHDEVSDVIDSGKWKGGVTYTWRSKNGKNDMVFSAIVLKDKVAKVYKSNTSLNYWADGTTLGKDFPDLYASGEKVEKKSAPVLEDPLDYTNGEEYADNAYKYFEYMGSEDPWNDALNYWDQNGP